ncbi:MULTISPECIES: iron-containing alcohol dehydrogenase [unclassified Pseudodesulfovibrio]|uniref:iron-containing alcohol dehydrogenase n=1 Tax=unclassified Pseudodesulfovibrio TaxID=2661612 RepID=UPI000FEBCB95|nr:MULTISPECIES: iron-containing alcohol dehydrogenase [unclassified Pseudodesulfovibrio]MCJ2164705.1 iron-containing alcohol dehydrogenase [Pseudodesulfovibrio sp. S3-i]RWU04105.1 iron-containing alcohol dehydrogenase [Pseudodesulfovibrio sp. S3]
MSYESFSTTQRVLFGEGSIASIVDELSRLNARNVLIVTDPGLVGTGIVDRLEDILKNGDVKSARFDKVEADPRYEIADEALTLLHSSRAEAVIGIGGGSSLDIAKIVSVLASNDQPVTEMFGIDLIKKPGLPLILIPTTAGTGSEVTPIVILSDEHEKLKKGVVSPYLFPSCALLDPELTLGLPPNVTAASGMDALIHALEAYTSKNATDMSDILAREAIVLIYNSIRTAYANGTNIKARSGMLRGSLLAGMAFANAGVTAVHAFAYPIGAEYHIPHGVANTIMLVPVMRFNMIGNLERFSELPTFFGLSTEGLSPRQAAQLGIDALVELAEDLNVPQHLSEYGVKEAAVPSLAESVMKVTRLLANNPRKLLVTDAERIYRAAL